MKTKRRSNAKIMLCFLCQKDALLCSTTHGDGCEGRRRPPATLVLFLSQGLSPQPPATLHPQRLAKKIVSTLTSTSAIPPTSDEAPKLSPLSPSPSQDRTRHLPKYNRCVCVCITAQPQHKKHPPPPAREETGGAASGRPPVPPFPFPFPPSPFLCSRGPSPSRTSPSPSPLCFSSAKVTPVAKTLRCFLLPLLPSFRAKLQCPYNCAKKRKEEDYSEGPPLLVIAPASARIQLAKPQEHSDP